jgi:hypothetical protein
MRPGNKFSSTLRVHVVNLSLFPSFYVFSLFFFLSLSYASFYFTVSLPLCLSFCFHSTKFFLTRNRSYARWPGMASATTHLKSKKSFKNSLNNLKCVVKCLDFFNTHTWDLLYVRCSHPRMCLCFNISWERVRASYCNKSQSS